MPSSAAAEAITSAASTSSASGWPRGGSPRSKVGWNSRVVVTAPHAPAVSGANRLSHSRPCIGRPASASEITSAAATGVPNSAPIVAASASTGHRLPGARGIRRVPSQAARPTFTAMIGFSGPRLGPPASISPVASTSPGSTSGGSTGAFRPTVAGSGPACPGTFHTTSPTASPVAVSITNIHSTE